LAGKIFAKVAKGKLLKKRLHFEGQNSMSIGNKHRRT
jgi:hypothetical protein